MPGDRACRAILPRAHAVTLLFDGKGTARRSFISEWIRHVISALEPPTLSSPDVE